MLDALKFVNGAVSKKDIVDELTHFRIRGGRITSYNGKLSLSSPIALDLDCCPKAAPFVAAIQQCEETAQLYLTPTGKLAIRSGAFRTHVDTLADAFTGIEPEGVPAGIGGPLLPTLRALYPVTSDDASRPWSNGIVFDGQFAFATNNVVLVQKWLPYHFPFRINIPRYAVKELIRIGEEPSQLLLTGSNASFIYSDGRWVRTQLVTHEWAKDPNEIFELMAPTGRKVPAGFFEALERLESFTAELGAVFLHNDAVSTTADLDLGTSVDVPGVPGGGVFNLEMLLCLKGLAQTIGFEEYPRPCPFYGEYIRGVIAGMRPK